MEEISGIAVYWAWFTLAALLAVGEIIAPGVFLIFIALAAACVGIITGLVTVPLAAQLIIFGTLSVAAVYMGRRWFQTADVSNDDPLLNDRTARMIGKNATVLETITANAGRVKVGGSEWPARGPNMKVGDTGRVAQIEDGVVVIEKHV